MNATRAPEARRTNASVKSAARVLDVFELLAASKAGLTFVELRDALDYPKSSLHGLLATMLGREFIALEPTTRRYRIGIRTWEAGQAFGRSTDLAAVAGPHLRVVRDELGETAQLAILEGLENVYVAKEDADNLLQLSSAVGRRLPAHATGLGKVLLAYLPAAELDKRLATAGPLQRFTDRTITSRPALLRELNAVRNRGYAVDNGECIAGVVCIAVPVYDHTASVVAAMSCTVPQVRIQQRTVTRTKMLQILREQARTLSEALGAPRGPRTSA
jgi:IclR family transcriptional regulator, KDG regulon repressor